MTVAQLYTIMVKNLHQEFNRNFQTDEIGNNLDSWTYTRSGFSSILSVKVKWNVQFGVLQLERSVNQ